ncbi:DNA-binding transcriptional MerR regulator [Desulfitispora alkaliphila]|uniref:MerR family transcriptional regulator n=1 Tax=Desulfitispora alkaliphila TaxID=622674 RepID=UPI003D1AF796
MTQKLTLQQISTILQVEISTLRFWEKEFSEFLDVNSPKGSRRRYNDRQLETFQQIKELLQTEMYTIKGAKRRIELEKTLTSAMGIEHNFKTAVFFMLTSIMEELQAAKEESKNLSQQMELLRKEKVFVENQLFEEQNKGLLDFLKGKIAKNETA